MRTGQFGGFGAALKRYRLETGLTQEELAERARVSARAIGALERGVNQSPRHDTLAMLADALGLSAQDRTEFEIAARRRGVLHPAGRAAVTTPAATDGGQTALPPLFGRASQLACLERHLRGDGPPVLFLAGEPGIGKTRLLREAVARAPGFGLSVVKGGCYRPAGQEPFAPIAGAIEAAIYHTPPARLRADLEGCEWLLRLLPELGELDAFKPPATLPPDQERRLMFRAVSRYLANIAGQGGTLLLLDDLQWASADALDALIALAHAARDVPLRVVAGYRSTELYPASPLNAALADLAHAELLVPLQLCPLDEHDARALLADLLVGTVDPAVEESVVRRSGGVPFFLASLAHQMAAQSPATGDLVPWDSTLSVRQRMAVLSAGAQDLLSALAVAGRHISRPVLLALGERLGQTREDVTRAVDAACQAGLLAQDGSSAYQFTHDLVHEAIAASIGPGRRATLHGWVAEAIEHVPGDAPAELLAHHYLEAGEPEKALAHLERAGDRAQEMHAYSDAVRAYRALVLQLDALDRSSAAAAAYEKLGCALTAAAQYDDALRALEHAATAYRTIGEEEALTRTMAHIGEAHVLRGTPDDGIAFLRAYVDVPRPPAVSAVAAASLHVSLAWLVNAAGHYVEALPIAERAVHLARDSGDAALLIQAELRRSQLLLMLGRLDDGAAVLRDLVPLAESAGDLRSLRLALNSLGWVHEAWGELERDREYTERALQAAERLGDPTVIAFMRSNHGGPAFNMGDWRQARTDFERGLAMMREIGPSWASAWPPLLLGQLLLAQGQTESAVDLLEEAVVLAERNQDLQAVRAAQSCLAERDLLDGRPAVAQARLEPLLDRPSQQEADVVRLLPLLAWAYAEMGHIDDAQQTAESSIARATATRMRPALVDAWRVRGIVHARQEQWETAWDALGCAVSLAREISYPYGKAKCLYTLGQLRAACGEATPACQHLYSAISILERLGEQLYAEHARHTLEALSHVSGSPSRSSARVMR